jgi:heme-degrading monooxygenase HmoA
MILVHDIFICKPGNASKLAKKFKEAMGNSKELVNIMSDMSGQYNRVIMVSKWDSLAAFENSWKEMEKDTEENKRMAKAMEGYQDMYLTGSREIYRTW